MLAVPAAIFRTKFSCYIAYIINAISIGAIGRERSNVRCSEEHVSELIGWIVNCDGISVKVVFNICVDVIGE